MKILRGAITGRKPEIRIHQNVAATSIMSFATRVSKTQPGGQRAYGYFSGCVCSSTLSYLFSSVKSQIRQVRKNQIPYKAITSRNTQCRT